MKPIRATLRAVTMNAVETPSTSGMLGVVAFEPAMTATLEFAGAHGPIRIEVPATTVSELVDRREPNRMSEVRYEVTIRRLRKAPRKNSRGKQL